MTKICICTTPIRPVPTTFPPLGSMSIIETLRPLCSEIKFLHIDYHRYNEEYLLNYFKENNFDFVGISAVVSTAYAYTKYLSGMIKSINKNTRIFVGGNLAASSQILLKKCKIDYCIIGDGEIISNNLINYLIKNKNVTEEELKEIKGICFLNKNNEFVFTGYGKAPSASNLLAPNWEILENENCLDHYMPDNGNSFKTFIPKFNPKGRTATIIVAKGCVARCTFCHRFEKGYRVNPNEKVIDHIKLLREKYGVYQLDIGDENFGSYKEQTLELIKKFKELNFSWKVAGVRAHTITPELLKAFKDNGCEICIFGIESGSPKMLKVMEKKITLEQNINALKWTHETKLATIVQLVIGMPGETDQTIDETSNFLINTIDYYNENFKKSLEYQISINYAQALPGTPLYEYAREHGYISRDIHGEEKYLLSISDKDAYENSHFLNYTQQPLLKVFTWRYRILWKVWRVHAVKNLNLPIGLINGGLSLICLSLNRIFKTKLETKLINKINKLYKEEKVSFNSQTSDLYYNVDAPRIFNYLLMSTFPWNKLTYPLMCLFVATKEKDNWRWFFKLIQDHLFWSFNIFKKIKLPDLTLRKIVKINEIDSSQLELGKGR